MSFMRQLLKGFIFDMDGVIVDNHIFHFQAWMEFAKKYNFNLDETKYRNEFNGKTNADLFRMIFGDLSEKQILEYSIEKESNYQSLYKSKIKPHEGVVSFLNYLENRGLKIALGTSAPKSNVDFTLDTLALRQYFEVIVDGSEVKRGKPNKEVYSKCCDALELPPNECIVFEDSIAGLQSGKSAGCQVIGVATSHTEAELLFETKRIIKDFTNLRFLEEFQL